MKLTKLFALSLGLLLATVSLANVASAQDTTGAELSKWRAEREAKLRADDGWPTVAGLFWLKEGLNTIGTGAANAIVLPAGSAPTQVGEFELREGKTIFRAAAGVTLTVNGQPVREWELKSDEVKPQDVLKLNDLTLLLLKRGARYAIRLKDKNALTRAEFAGLRWYPGQDGYRVTGQFIPYAQPKEVRIANIIGDVETMTSPGYVVFKLNGQELTLEPVTSGSDKLFFIIRDLTSGKTTYQPGRFLYTALPQDGQVVLDFNQAINPPCAFTAYATCPLPPKRNHLPVFVAAGEQTYHKPAGSHAVAARTGSLPK